MKNVKSKITTIILLVLAILIVLIVVNFVRNYIILSNLLSLQQENLSANSFEFTCTFYDGDSTMPRNTVISKSKDNSKMFIMNQNEFNRTLISIYNEKTDKTTMIYPANKKFTTDDGNKLVGIGLPAKFNESNIKMYALFSLITEENVNSEDCYKINCLSIITGDTTYISKEKGYCVRNIMKYTSTDTNKKTTQTTDYSNYHFNSLTDKDFETPDLTDYEGK